MASRALVTASSDSCVHVTGRAAAPRPMIKRMAPRTSTCSGHRLMQRASWQSRHRVAPIKMLCNSPRLGEYMVVLTFWCGRQVHTFTGTQVHTYLTCLLVYLFTCLPVYLFTCLPA